MTAGRCGTCRWWDTNFQYPPKGFGHCAGVVDGEVNDFMRPVLNNVNDDVEAFLKADFVASGTAASMFTRPDFGCMLWEAREEKVRA